MGSSAFPTASVSPADLAPAPLESFGLFGCFVDFGLARRGEMRAARPRPHAVGQETQRKRYGRKRYRVFYLGGSAALKRPPFKFLFPKTDISSPQRQAEALVLEANSRRTLPKRKTHVADIIVYSLRSRHRPAEFRV